MYFIRKKLHNFDKERPGALRHYSFNVWSHILHLRNISRMQREKGREKEKEDKSLRANILPVRKEKYHDQRFKSFYV